MAEAAFHQDINYGSAQISEDLIHDSWSCIKESPRRPQQIKQKIDVFSIWTATQSPAHQLALQQMFWDIVPEDMPPEEKRFAQI